jgi:hypothetical protein
VPDKDNFLLGVLFQDLFEFEFKLPDCPGDIISETAVSRAITIMKTGPVQTQAKQYPCAWIVKKTMQANYYRPCFAGMPGLSDPVKPSEGIGEG